MNKSLIIFGIVNITSDSFSDGGRYLAPDAAIAQARKLMAEGADVIDLGPASSNPDAAPVSSDTEIARIAPVLDALKADGIPVSLDSYQPATQAYALSRGVAYLNDIRGSAGMSPLRATRRQDNRPYGAQIFRHRWYSWQSHLRASSEN